MAQTVKCRTPSFNPWVRKSPWRRKWQPTPVLLPGESHGQRSLVGYSPQGHKKSDTTEGPHFHFLFSAWSIIYMLLKSTWAFICTLVSCHTNLQAGLKSGAGGKFRDIELGYSARILALVRVGEKRGTDFPVPRASLSSCPAFVSVTKSHSFATPWNVTCHTLLPMGFLRQEYWSGCHFFLQGILPIQGSNSGLSSIAGGFFTAEPSGKPFLLPLNSSVRKLLFPTHTPISLVKAKD